MAPIACYGVAVIEPWPIDRLAVCPAPHSWPYLSFTICLLGRKPSGSPSIGRPTLAPAEQPGDAPDFFEADLLAELVEIRVARVFDGGSQVEFAVAFSVPTKELAPVDFDFCLAGVLWVLASGDAQCDDYLKD